MFTAGESTTRFDTGSMRKTRSVDFGSLRARLLERDETVVASQFSRRAARETYKERNSFPSVKEASWRSNHCESFDRDSDYSDALHNHGDNSSTNGRSISLRIPATWTVGKLSVFILLLALCVDLLVCRLQDLGDAKQQHAKPSLGSAAISSVTERLAPILPFTGGLDLRREDYWATSGSWYEKLQSVATQVQDSFSSADKASDTVDSAKMPSQPVKQRKQVTAHVSTISAQQPFVSVSEIADLTLSDVSETFRYAVEANKPGFQQTKYMNSLAPRVKQVIQTMVTAVETSRGIDTKLSIADASESGQVDALLFCAAMRIFAEWRVVRQVPEGYKGFAVGMSLGHKDIVQNVAKVEATVHAFLNHRRDMLDLEAQWEANGAAENCPIDGSKPRCLRSPTIREVMQYEIDMNVNPSSQLPRLKDKSGSMGILWTRRQLYYQTLLLDNVQHVPESYATTAAAVLAAYNEVYDKFHGWAVQKIFNYSFQSAPEAKEIFKHMNPHRLQEAKSEARRRSMSNAAHDGALPITKSAHDDGNPVAALLHHVGGEWDKLVANVVHVFDKSHKATEDVANIRGGDSVNLSEMDEYVVQAMIKDAHERIPAYLAIVYPLLDDLAATFANLNMNDPTRV